MGQVKAEGPGNRARQSLMISQGMGEAMIEEKGQVTSQGMYQVKDQVMRPDKVMAERHARQLAKQSQRAVVHHSLVITLLENISFKLLVNSQA